MTNLALGNCRVIKYTVKKGKTPELAQEEARELLGSIDTSTVVGLRDRTLIATMIYTFGRVGGHQDARRRLLDAGPARLGSIA
jgi:hypothetical protein